MPGYCTERECRSSIRILYATREGPTHRIAEHVAAALRGCGFAVTVTNVRDHSARRSLNACTAAILAASVHAGRYEPEIVQFVKEHVASWNACRRHFSPCPSVRQAQSGPTLPQKSMPSLWPTCKKSLTGSLQRRDGITNTPKRGTEWPGDGARDAETRSVARDRGLPGARSPYDRLSGNRYDIEVTLCHLSPLMRRV
jgi:flavodoxin-like protein